eukprot:GHVL01004447.1.p1 GENE.GHVL01004447.1~~GHVL01004447.1.p1  ORF type:complete len:139 (+),score=29.60 GHVL01004447.1:45-461(+)
MKNFCEISENSPVLLEDETIMYDRSDIEWNVDSVSSGLGTLFLTTKRIIWISGDTGHELDYRSVILHAICRDIASFPRPCLYCHIEPEGHEEDEPVKELRLVPHAEMFLDEIFSYFCDMAAMHSDPPVDSSDDNEDFL